MKILLALLSLVLPMTAQKLLVVDVDDLGKEFLDANPQPLFDALDSHGRYYSRFYTAPVCSPTRAMAHYGVRGGHPDLRLTWLVGPAHSPYVAPTDGPLVPLGQAVAGGGFTTAHIGKWHLAPNSELGHPNDSGWQYRAGPMSNVTDFYNWTANVNGTNIPHVSTYLTHWETDQALAAVAAGYDLVWVSYHSIHDPWHNPPGGTATTIEGQAAEMLADLAAEIDRLGCMASAAGYYLILFSDNGGKPQLGGDKGSIREGGVNTDMWIYGPGIPAGPTDDLVSVMDVYATVCDFFGITRTPQMGPQSVSLIPGLLGRPGRESVFCERFLTNGVDPALFGMDTWRRVTIGQDYKLTHLFHERFYLLPNEQLNLLSTGLTPAEQVQYDFLTAEFQGWTQ